MLFSQCTAEFCARKRVEGGMDYGSGALTPHSSWTETHRPGGKGRVLRALQLQR